MPAVLTCLEFDAQNQCIAEAWVEQPTWHEMLPTVEQANGVGGLLFASLVILAATKRLLKPPKETEL